MLPPPPTATNCPFPKATLYKKSLPAAPVLLVQAVPFVEVHKVPWSPTITVVPFPEVTPYNSNEIFNVCVVQVVASVEVYILPSLPTMIHDPLV
ncbi:hypothetical protein D3C75_1142040 [compost metagenome]